jgi:hypothetical protein
MEWKCIVLLFHKHHLCVAPLIAEGPLRTEAVRIPKQQPLTLINREPTAPHCRRIAAAILLSLAFILACVAQGASHDVLFAKNQSEPAGSGSGIGDGSSTATSFATNKGFSQIGILCTIWGALSMLGTHHGRNSPVNGVSLLSVSFLFFLLAAVVGNGIVGYPKALWVAASVMCLLAAVLHWLAGEMNEVEMPPYFEAVYDLAAHFLPLSRETNKNSDTLVLPTKMKGTLPPIFIDTQPTKTELPTNKFGEMMVTQHTINKRNICGVWQKTLGAVPGRYVVGDGPVTSPAIRVQLQGKYNLAESCACFGIAGALSPQLRKYMCMGLCYKDTSSFELSEEGEGGTKYGALAGILGGSSLLLGAYSKCLSAHLLWFEAAACVRP